MAFVGKPITDMQQQETASRLEQALTRAVLDNLKPNRVMIPCFAAVVCAMFAQWVPLHTMAIWYGLVLASLVPTVWVSRAIPARLLTPRETDLWTRRATVANMIYVAAWNSMGWFLWAPGVDFDHMLIQLGLAASLAAHGSLVGSSRRIALPAFGVYAIGMTLTPLQAHSVPSNWLAFITPFYVAYIATIARQHANRARANLILAEEKNRLIAELAFSKSESDKARDRAEAASLAKSQFLANMSHELRTPLNAIIGFSELISTRMFKDIEKNYEYAGLIHQSGNHLLALINDILDLAKIEAGRWRLSETNVALGDLAADMQQWMGWKAEQKCAAIHADIPAGLPPVFADPRALKQIWLNLLTNAVKFTPADGRITVFARLDEAGGMLFGVADTGMGISQEDQARVFESFGQGRHDIAVADKGTGLGLAIVKGLAQAHGGSVTLESRLHQGTTVTVRLPEARVPRARAVAQTAA